MRDWKYHLATLAGATLCASASALAQVGSIDRGASSSESTIDTMIRNAKPLPKPRRKVNPDALLQMPPIEPMRHQPKVVPGNPGADGGRSGIEIPRPPARSADDLAAPQNWGVGRMDTPQHYSDARVDTAAVVNYPFRVAGKLYFKKPSGATFVCSATLVSSSIIMTAGHCVHSAEGWHNTFIFIPAKSGDYEPYGRVKAAKMYTTGQWVKGHKLAEGIDIALIVLKKTSRGTEIGSELGWVGFCYLYCVQNYQMMTTLGYPGNYENGLWMTSSQHLSVRSPDSNGEYFHGTGMEGGSSGGAHIVNLGDVYDTSTSAGQYWYRNVIFGVESYGPDGDPKVGWAATTSGYNNRNKIREMFNSACGKAQELHGPSSCAMIP